MRSIADLPAGLRALTVEDEQREVLAVLNGKGGNMPRIKLEYLKDSKEKMAWTEQYGIDGRMWNVLAPEGHALHPFHNSTRTLDGLKELGIVS